MILAWLLMARAQGFDTVVGIMRYSGFSSKKILPRAMTVFAVLQASCWAQGAACRPYLDVVEATTGMPKGLLHAIADVESGRRQLPAHPSTAVSARITHTAWPWTIHANGQGHYFATKREAIEKVKELMQQGVRSIDVGCMQINLRHHADAFGSLDDAFDPWRNIRYAAQFLQSLKRSHGSWQQAIAHYHSATPALHGPYRDRVTRAWRRIMNTHEDPKKGKDSDEFPKKPQTVRRPLTVVHQFKPLVGWQAIAHKPQSTTSHHRPDPTSSLAKRLKVAFSEQHGDKGMTNARGSGEHLKFQNSLKFFPIRPASRAS